MPYSFRHVYHSLLLNVEAIISAAIKYYVIQTYCRVELIITTTTAFVTNR